MRRMNNMQLSVNAIENTLGDMDDCRKEFLLTMGGRTSSGSAAEASEYRLLKR